MKKILLVAAIVLSFLGVQSAVQAANGDKCIVDSQCSGGGKCVKDRIGPNGTCAGGY
jgi:hypothetical protein